jgi:hypothetical protein
MKKIILTEEQLKKVIDNVVNEQNGVRTESLTVQMGSIWPMGKWKITTQQINQLTPKLEQITNFINKNRDSIVTIQIEAGESQVTNVDNESPSKPKLSPGVLSQRRGDTMVDFLTGYFRDLMNKDLIKKLPEIPKPKQIIGTTDYKKGITDLKDPNVVATYQKEQFVNAVITTRKDYECLVGMEITIGYYPNKNKSQHKCDEAIFELKMNGIQIGEVNLNNWGMDLGVDPVYEINKNNYLTSKKEAENSFDELVRDGKIKNPNDRKKEKFVEKYVINQGFENPGELTVPRWAEIKYTRFGRRYTSPEQYLNDIKTINNSFNTFGGRKTDNKVGGARSQTFVLNGEIAKSIIDQSQTNEIILSIKPLVSNTGKYKLFFHSGSHSDTPWVTIKSRKSETPLFDAEPNIGMERGSEKETILLRTDLCGNPIQNNRK